MRRAMGPFLTTGVALVAATVVVANPVTPPSRDMQISTTQLSTSPELLTPFDKSMLNAMVPPFPPAGIGPALAQILAALAADADRISREVNSGAAAGDPIAPATADQASYHPPQIDSLAVESIGAPAAASITSFAPPITSPAVQAVVSGLVADTSYLGGKVVEAAYAVVDVIIRVPQVVVTAVLALLHGDFSGALAGAQAALQDFFGPGLIILDAIRDVIVRNLPSLPGAAAATVPAAATSTVSLPAGADASAGTEPAPAADAGSAPAAPGRTGSGGSARKRAAVESLSALRPTASTPKSRAGGAAGQVAAPAAASASPSVPQSPAAGAKATAGSARTAAASGSQQDARPGAKSGSAAD